MEINHPTSDEIHEYDTEKLIEYLQTVKKLNLNEKHFEIIRKVEITGENFLKITEKKLCDFGFSFGLAERIVSFAKECSEQKRQKYSSIKSLRDVLKDYGVDSNNISRIPSFEPQTHKIQDNDDTDNIFEMAVEYEVNGKKYYGSTDYAIIESKSGNLICITEDKIDKSMQEGFAQNIRQLESSHDVNKKKRKRDSNEDFDYLYGIITSAREWYFLLHNPEEISLSNVTPFVIEYCKEA
ncbi:43750_t:CDS:2 [Gigaspora margarita]|uniref:43750_t:CDS:1 n=1 Tax=Gigaspora margarita TaxID=4874 RepID=A0ABN7W6E0_GIGMA|nr:43750_t:CDS:2 [Gigaspora margarita]